MVWNNEAVKSTIIEKLGENLPITKVEMEFVGRSASVVNGFIDLVTQLDDSTDSLLELSFKKFMAVELDAVVLERLSSKCAGLKKLVIWGM